MTEASTLDTVTVGELIELLAAVLAAGIAVVALVAASAWAVVIVARYVGQAWRRRRGWATCLSCTTWCPPGAGEVCERCAAWAVWAAGAAHLDRLIAPAPDVDVDAEVPAGA